MSNRSNESNRPTHGLYQVRNEKAPWVRVGSAWLHKDERGANLIFDSIPLTGRVVLRELTEGEQSGDDNRASEGGAQ